MKDRSNELDFAISIAKEAGALMRKNFKMDRKIEFKDDNTEITETDLAINDLVLKKIREHYPEHNLLAEEESDMQRKTDFVWVCDPIDGTLAFARGIPTSTFSLALTRNGESILGVVYDPFMDRLYYAEKGKGAYLNDKKINVSKQNKLSESMITLISWKNAPFRVEGLYPKLIKQGVHILDFGSAVYDGCLVASGKFEALIFPQKKPHDSVALKIIIEEAGGKVTSLFGKDQKYNGEISGLLASNGLIHEELVSLIKSELEQN